MGLFEADKALLELKEGNERFVSGGSLHRKIDMRELEELAAKGQRPFATVVCCSDSRVPPELIFDQGFGRLFVVRTAGHTLDEAGLGSVEYGAEHLHIPLIVVLGHENCGAVKAAVENGQASGAVKAVVDKIKRSLDRLSSPADVYEECANENIRTTVAEISANPAVGRLIVEGGLRVVGAKYSLRSGRVIFF